LPEDAEEFSQRFRRDEIGGPTGFAAHFPGHSRDAQPIDRQDNAKDQAGPVVRKKV
jgi:hypothetical protein